MFNHEIISELKKFKISNVVDLRIALSSSNYLSNIYIHFVLIGIFFHFKYLGFADYRGYFPINNKNLTSRKVKTNIFLLLIIK